MKNFQFSIFPPALAFGKSRWRAGNFQFKKNLQPLDSTQGKPTTYNTSTTLSAGLQPNHGFTLVELLIVVTLLGFIGVITSQIFIINIRSQLRSELMKEVKQNGDYAMSVIEIMVKNAVDVTVGCGTSSNQLTIMNPDGFPTTFTCTEGDKIASESQSLSQTLTNNKVAIYNCASAFRVVCPDPPASPKYVFVTFKIQQAGSGLIPTPGSITSLEYQTTISLRNYE